MLELKEGWWIQTGLKCVDWVSIQTEYLKTPMIRKFILNSNILNTHLKTLMKRMIKLQKITYLEENKTNCKVNIVCKCGRNYTIFMKSAENAKCECGITYKAFYTGWIVSEFTQQTPVGKIMELGNDKKEPVQQEILY